MTRIEIRRMERWPYPVRPGWERVTAPFGGGYVLTLNKLDVELEHLDAGLAVIELTGRKVDIRVDGYPTARSLIDPPVLMSFDSAHGQLSYACDRYDHWHGNLHAIALTLDRLRAVDRYACAAGGQQYQGWAQLPAGGWKGSGPPERFLAGLLSLRVDEVLADPIGAVRKARKKAHPDTGGSTELFVTVQEAATALGVA